MNLLKNINIVTMHRGSTAVASTDIDSGVMLDMSGYEGALFITGIVETTAGGTTGSAMLVPRHSSISTTSGLTDLGSTGQAGVTATLSTADWGKQLVVDVYRPTKRYLSVSLNKAGAASWDNGPIIAIQYGGKAQPVTQSSSYVLSSKQLISPTT